MFIVTKDSSHVYTTALYIAHTKGVLHHDISHRNILWYYHEGSARVLLIDYDCAVYADNDKIRLGVSNII